MRLIVLSWLAGLLGFALLVAGVAMINIPAALITGGGCLLAWARLADQAAAARSANAKGG